MSLLIILHFYIGRRLHSGVSILLNFNQLRQLSIFDILLYLFQSLICLYFRMKNYKQQINQMTKNKLFADFHMFNFRFIDKCFAGQTDTISHYWWRKYKNYHKIKKHTNDDVVDDVIDDDDSDRS